MKLLTLILNALFIMLVLEVLAGLTREAQLKILRNLTASKVATIFLTLLWASVMDQKSFINEKQ